MFFGLSVSLLIQVMAPRFVGLFTSDEAVIASGGPYLKGYIFDTIFAGIHFLLAATSVQLKIHLFFSPQSYRHRPCEDSFRLFGIPGLFRFPFPMGLVTASGSLLSVLICCFLFRHLERERTEVLQN